MATPTENCEIKNNEVKTGNKPGQIAPELAKYLDNPFVSEIHGNRIFYTNEFYVAMAKRIHDEQMTYEDAYESLGFHVSDLGINRAQQAGKNAMEKFKQGKFIPKPGSYDGSIPLEQMPEMSTEEENAYLKARVIYLEAMNEVQKNPIDIGGELYIFESQQIKIDRFAVMQSFLDGHYYREHMNDFSIETVCKMFHVSTSGYYSWLGKTRDIASRKAKEERDRIVKDCMLKIVKNRHYVPGKRTFKLDLERSFELQVSLRRIRSLMKEMNLVANVPKKDPYKHQATHDHEYAAPAENLLNRRFYIGPRKVILTDITYMPFAFGQEVAYHCEFRDAFTKEPLGWKNSMKMTVEDLVRPAYNMMMENHGSELHDPDIYIHSDQGSQYLSTTIQQLLKDDEFIQSVSGRGNSWDNSPMESFFATMKSALLGIVAMAMDFQTVSYLIDGYLIQYNEKDAQYDLAGLSPKEFYAYITTGVYPLDSYFGVDAKRLVSPAELVEQRRKRAKEATEKARKRAAEKKASGMSYTGKEPDKVILRDIRIIEREQKKWNKTKKTAELQCSFLDKLLAKAEAALQFVSNASQQVKIDLLDRQSWKKYTQLNYIYDMKGMF